MRYSLDDYLQVVASHLPPALLSPQALLHIRRLARALAPASLFGFESRLATPAATADFAIGLTPEFRSRALFAGSSPHDDAAGLLAAPGWARFHAFAARWADPTSPLYSDVGTVWLEFDVAGGGEIPAPNVLFGIRASQDPQALAEAGLECLLGQSLPVAIRHQLSRCYAGLPPRAHIFQVGAMLARQARGVRVCVYPVRPEQIVPYLQRIGWLGPLDEVADVLAPFCHMAVNLALNVDAGDGVGPKIGLECYLDERRDPQLGPRWPALLEHLVAHGMCTPEKHDALLGWPGWQRTSQFIWPSLFLRLLNHLKLVYAPGQPLEAKAYWGVIQHWSRMDGAMEGADRSTGQQSGTP